MAKKKKQLKPEFIWCIAYIDSDQLEKTQEYLDKYEEYANVEAYIPVVRILKKTFKNKNEFENIPLLFNYGFFKVPKNFIRNPEFFVKMQQRIPVIYHWVKDLANGLEIKPRYTLIGTNKVDDGKVKPPRKNDALQIAVASEKEIERIRQVKSDISIFDKSDIENIKEGSEIILRGYPWQDMRARIIKLDYKKEQARVELILDHHIREVTVALDNIFYTIYSGDHKIEPIREKSIEDLKIKKKSFANPEMEEA